MESKQELRQEIIDIKLKLKKTLDIWTEDQSGNINEWYNLMSKIVKIIQDNYGGKMKGTEKAILASQTINNIANNLWAKFTHNLSQDEKNELKKGKLKILALVMENPEILEASTSFLKQLLTVLDTNNDGEISAEECCFCIPMN